jgi:hypothetical protein
VSTHSISQVPSAQWNRKLTIGTLATLFRPSRTMLSDFFCLASRMSTSFRLSVAAFGFIKQVVSEPHLVG